MQSQYLNKKFNQSKLFFTINLFKMYNSIIIYIKLYIYIFKTVI